MRLSTLVSSITALAWASSKRKLAEASSGQAAISLVDGNRFGQFLSISILLPPATASARKLNRQILAGSALENSHKPIMALVASLNEFRGCVVGGGSLDGCAFGGCGVAGCVSCASALPQRQPTTTLTIRLQRLMAKLLTPECYHSRATPSCDLSFGPRSATAFPGPALAEACRRPRQECCRRQADPSCRGYEPTPSRGAGTARRSPSPSTLAAHAVP